jgi:hypothetical protein
MPTTRASLSARAACNFFFKKKTKGKNKSKKIIKKNKTNNKKILKK